MTQPTPFFPETPWTSILRARDHADPRYQEHLGRLIQAYWRPVYWWLRKKKNCSDEEARDLTQEFFTHAIERETFRSVTTEKGRFRTFLLVVLKNFFLNQRRLYSTEKRGGGAPHVAMSYLKEEQLDWEPPSRELTPDQAFDLCWIESVTRRAWKEVEEKLRADGKLDSVEIFRSLVLDVPPEGPPSYRELGRRLSLSVDEVHNRLSAVKHLLRTAIRRQILDYVESAEEADRELRDLFGSGL